MIGGNIQLELQTATETVNAIGAKSLTWQTVQTLTGWLDYSSGEAGRMNYDAKLQESTHFFICDYTSVSVTPEQCRAVVKNMTYDVLLIDNPMEMNRQLEIYLKYTGAQVNE